MPKKFLGQHFLSDPRLLGRIADALPAADGDPVLEIGPGRGALTRALLKRGFRVTAIERDRDLVPSLKALFPGLSVLEGDALRMDWPASVAATTSPWWVIGNIPYNITSPLIDHALGAEPAPSAIVYLIQKEVALRLGASSGTREYGALTVGVQSAARVERLFSVPAGAFRPAPKVDSALVRLTPFATQDRVADPIGFRRLVVGLFGARRKQLARALRTVLGVEPATALHLAAQTGVAPDQRPETLTVAEFLRLWGVVVDEGVGRT